MERRRERQQAQRIEEALARAVEAGVVRGRQLERQEALTQTAGEIFREEVREVVAAMTSFEKALDYVRAVAPRWISRWRRAFSPGLLTQMQQTTMQTDRGPVSLSFDLTNPRLEEFFRSYTLRLATQVTETTRERLEEVIREASREGHGVPETARRIREVGEEFSGYRAALIARTELHRAQIAAQEIQVREAGVCESKTWMATPDNRTRESHRKRDGMTVAIDENWDGLHPQTEINCRCWVRFNIRPGILDEPQNGGAA